MDQKTIFLQEFEHECSTTKKFLEAYDESKADYKPHEKSMGMAELTSHLVEAVSWMEDTVTKDEIVMDMKNYKPFRETSKDAILKQFDEEVKKALDILKNAKEEEMGNMWSMKDTEGKVMFQMPKAGVIRNFMINHLIHHRAQLGVFFRMNNIPVPQSYGPTADFPQM